MGKVVYEDPIHHISGKISKKYRTGYAYRKRMNGNGENTAYTFVRGERDGEVSPAEQAARDRFKTVAQMVNMRKCNPMTLVQDQLAFRAQTTCKTLNKFMWQICMAEYDAM